jgi:hypothetical protein
MTADSYSDDQNSLLIRNQTVHFRHQKSSQLDAIIIQLITSYTFLMLLSQVTGPWHHNMACPQIADGGDGFQVWRVAANILKKQLRTTDKWWYPSLGVGRGANNFSPQK